MSCSIESEIANLLTRYFPARRDRAKLVPACIDAKDVAAVARYLVKIGDWPYILAQRRCLAAAAIERATHRTSTLLVPHRFRWAVAHGARALIRHAKRIELSVPHKKWPFGVARNLLERVDAGMDDFIESFRQGSRTTLAFCSSFANQFFNRFALRGREPAQCSSAIQELGRLFQGAYRYDVVSAAGVLSRQERDADFPVVSLSESLLLARAGGQVTRQIDLANGGRSQIEVTSMFGPWVLGEVAPPGTVIQSVTRGLPPRAPTAVISTAAGPTFQLGVQKGTIVQSKPSSGIGFDPISVGSRESIAANLARNLYAA